MRAVNGLITSSRNVCLLAFVTVFAVQTFDDIAVFRAGEHAGIPPFAPLFNGLKRQPGDPEYWWLWLVLFSALIPSAVNLCFAAASLIRGLPFLNTRIVKRMQATSSMRDSDRLLLARALSAQVAGGFLATGGALYLIGVSFLPIWLPILGACVRDFSEALAALQRAGSGHDVLYGRAVRPRACAMRQFAITARRQAPYVDSGLRPECAKSGSPGGAPTGRSLPHCDGAHGLRR